MAQFSEMTQTLSMSCEWSCFGLLSALLYPGSHQRPVRKRLSARGPFLTGVLVGLSGLAFVVPRAFGQGGDPPRATTGVPETLSESRDQLRLVPVADVTGRIVQLRARICRPLGDDPEQLVVINHGSPPDAAARPKMQLGRCDREAAQWFLSRGYAVVFALRRGYGETGGDWAENYDGCARAEYVRAGIETARDIDAVVNYATALPFVLHEGAIVVGQSAGGWGTIAYDASPIPGSAHLS